MNPQGRQCFTGEVPRPAALLQLCYRRRHPLPREALFTCILLHVVASGLTPALQRLLTSDRPRKVSNGLQKSFLAGGKLKHALRLRLIGSLFQLKAHRHDNTSCIQKIASMCAAAGPFRGRRYWIDTGALLQLCSQAGVGIHGDALKIGRDWGLAVGGTADLSEAALERDVDCAESKWSLSGARVVLRYLLVISSDELAFVTLCMLPADTLCAWLLWRRSLVPISCCSSFGAPASRGTRSMC